MLTPTQLHAFLPGLYDPAKDARVTAVKPAASDPPPPPSETTPAAPPPSEVVPESPEPDLYHDDESDDA